FCSRNCAVTTTSSRTSRSSAANETAPPANRARPRDARTAMAMERLVDTDDPHTVIAIRRVSRRPQTVELYSWRRCAVSTYGKPEPFVYRVISFRLLQCALAVVLEDGASPTVSQMHHYLSHNAII